MSERTYHTGRLIDHVHIVVRDLDKSRVFYKAVLRALGRDLSYESNNDFESDELFVSESSSDIQVSRLHLAFQAPDRETVNAFYQAALASGGTDNGAPGKRPYHKGYYAAFVYDPDGNNIEAVFHGPTERSSSSVEITRL